MTNSNASTITQVLIPNSDNNNNNNTYIYIHIDTIPLHLTYLLVVLYTMSSVYTWFVTYLHIRNICRYVVLSRYIS